METRIITAAYLEDYERKQRITLSKHFGKLPDVAAGSRDFGYHLSVASVYSSRIEGNPMDLDSYLRFETSGMNTTSKSFQEIQDLVAAYELATHAPLDRAQVMNAHLLLSRHLLDEEHYKGQLRDKNVFIYGGGQKIYEGATATRIGQYLFRRPAMVNGQGNDH